MPVLLHRLGLGLHANSSCRSPFREDKNPSWGIFQRAGRWFFKDHGTGESGDECALLAKARGLDQAREFPEIIRIYAEIAGIDQAKESAASIRPNRSGFCRGTAEQLKRLSLARPYGLEGLVWASERGLLVFGNWHGLECYGVTDSSGRVLEIRRLDGRTFPAFGDLHDRKSHALRGSDKHWPVGIIEASEFLAIALVEGIPDFLEAHYLALWEQASDHRSRTVQCAPVGMLSSSPSIAEDALSHFAGKHVRVFPHADPTGNKAGKRWAKQLHAIAGKVELFNFAGLRRADGKAVIDLYDCRELDPAEYLNDESLWKLLP